MKILTRQRLIGLAAILVIIVTGLRVFAYTHTSTLSMINTGADTGGIAADFDISGNALYDGFYVNATTTNAKLTRGTTEIPIQLPSLRKPMNGAVADDGGVTTNETTASNNSTANDMTLLPAIPVVNDAYYFGADNQFRILTLNISQRGAGVYSLTWQYWDGASWTGVSNLTDGTNNFKEAGLKAVSYDLPSGWKVTTVGGVANKYWLRAIVSSFTSITTQPKGQQAWWETGVLWAFVEEIDEFQQINYRLSLGGTGASETVTNHKFFPGTDGYTTPDNAALELGSGYLLEMTGYFSTASASGAASYYLTKSGALDISNPSANLVRININSGAKVLNISNVPNGLHTFRLSDDGADINFLIAGVGSATATSTAVTDNANSWQWGMNSTTVYFDNIKISFPVERLDDTTAEWDSGTLVGVDGINNALQMPEQGDVDACIGSSDDVIGWTDSCGSGDFVRVVSLPVDTGSKALYVQNNSGVTTQPFVSQNIAATPGQVWSGSIRCYDDANGSTFSLRIGFLNASLTLIGSETIASVGCNSIPSVYQTVTNNNNTAPALTVWVRYRFGTTSTTTAGDDDRTFDSAVLALGAVAPSFGDVSNVLTNPGFESVYSVGSGTRVSPGLTVTSVTNLLDSSITWVASGTVAGLTTVALEVSLDNESTWLPATNGAFIPGLTVGQSLAALPAMKTRATLTTATVTMTPYLVSLALSLLDSDDRDLYYAPIEFIGTTLDDRSDNDIDAVATYPEPLGSQFTMTVGPLTASTNPTVTDPSTVSPDSIGQQNETTLGNTPSNLSTIPIMGWFVATLSDVIESDDAVADGLEVIIWLFLLAIGVGTVGIIFIEFAKSIMISALAMLAFLLFATNFHGLIPLETFILAGIGLIGWAAWSHRA